MRCLCQFGNSAAYATGTVAETGARLSHPGGLAQTRYALQSAELWSGARVIDVGCGAGESLGALEALGYQSVGVDPRDAEIAMRSAPILRAWAEALPFPDGWADAVLAECSLSVTEYPQRALAECARVLAPRGRLIISDMYARNPAAISAVRTLPGACVSGIIVREELEELLSELGFFIKVWEDHSRELGEFVARLLMDGGSLASLWGCGGEVASATQVEAAMKKVRPGYFLMIAARCAIQRSEQ